MADQLTCFCTRAAEAHAIHHVVEALLKKLQQDDAGGALPRRGLLVVVEELAFQHAVHLLQLLLFAQLQGVVRQADAACAVLAWRGVELALAIQRASATLQKQVGPDAAGQFAFGADVTSHSLLCLFLDATALGRPATVVRDRRHVGDVGDLEADGVE